MVWQRTGTVAVQNGSTTVTGTGVDFAASSRVGDSFIGPDGVSYEVANVASGTVISILPPYKGPTASGADYAIMPVQGYDKMLSDAFNNLNNQFGPKLAALGTTGNYDILPLTKGGTGATDQPGARTALGLGTAATSMLVTSPTDATAGRSLTVGYGGLGSKDNAPFVGVGLNPDSYRTGAISIWGQFVIAGVGSFTGFLSVIPADNLNLWQSMVNGATGARYERVQSGGTWGAWTPVISGANATLDPTSGGLMWAGAVSGFSIFKYANGQMCMLGTAPTTGNLPANSINYLTVTIPSGLVSNTGLARPVASVRATAANDHYGIISCDLATPTSISIILRSGATAQTYNVNVSVWGQWK